MTDSRSYRGLVDDATQSLFSNSDTPRIDAEVLMLHVVQKPLAWLIAHGDKIALDDHLKQFYTLIEQRQQGQPIAYLVGHKEFWSMSLKVTPDVLIPRPDTETVVEQALVLLEGIEKPNILDLGTGSGAIALALAKEIPESSVLALDASKPALDVARENAARLGLSNMRFVESDWFAQVGAQQYDLIVSNPPYVEVDDPHLAQGDLRFEPSSALVSAGNGLDDIRVITQQARRYLRDEGHLIVEHGFDQSHQVAALFKAEGFVDIQQHKDLNGVLRCTCGRRSL